LERTRAELRSTREALARAEEHAATLARNLSAVYHTAKREMAWKDRAIAELKAPRRAGSGGGAPPAHHASERGGAPHAESRR